MHMPHRSPSFNTKPRVPNPRICRGRSSSIGAVCGKDMRVGITDRRLQSTSTIDDPSTSEGPDSSWVHRNIDFFNNYIKIYVKITEKTRKFSSTSLEDRHQQKRSRAAYRTEKCLCCGHSRR